ncbi:MAG: membrane or secreted protein [Pirellulales bacterium]|nr:membrane or secreted protein [Pirellulales bacterium]
MCGLLLGGLVAVGGCQWQHIAMPQWCNPGTTKEQQQRALQFDPFPATDIGPPIPGARPREYDRPSVEPHRPRYQ